MPRSSIREELRNRYPVSLTIAPDLENLSGEYRFLSEFLDNCPDAGGFPPYLADIARIEESRFSLLHSPPFIPKSVQDRTVNPALDLIPVNFSNLPALMADQGAVPIPGSGFVLVWIRPSTRDIEIRDASADDLLALKIVAEETDPAKAAAQGGISLRAVDDLLYSAGQQGLLLAPRSLIRRPQDFPAGEITDPSYFISKTFTIQWHITQVCDLNCRHCYDRSDRKTMTLQQAIGVLDSFYDFCRRHHVFGQVSFSGGNPMLYPHFDQVYKEAADRGFMTAILGNPMPLHRIEKMLLVQKPEFYQVSLEGTKAHNDYIRGTGHYERTMEFLDLLGSQGIYRMVMLTLTRDNMDQVLALAESLNGHAELFTFNRLASMGQGAQLSAADPDLFPGFLSDYMEAAKSNALMAFKDNLFNLLRWHRSLPNGGGCTGYGCGAAFNFVSVLPDGEVHACRKMPSQIGNIYEQPLHDIYHGTLARKYRGGSAACSGCAVRPVCGGCLAVARGHGLDIFSEVDPYCFIA